MDNNDLIKAYLKEYSIVHTKEDTIELIKNLISKKDIGNLPNKLAEIGLKDLLETKRGQGYILK